MLCHFVSASNSSGMSRQTHLGESGSSEYAAIHGWAVVSRAQTGTSCHLRSEPHLQLSKSSKLSPGEPAKLGFAQVRLVLRPRPRPNMRQDHHAAGRRSRTGTDNRKLSLWTVLLPNYIVVRYTYFR